MSKSDTWSEDSLIQAFAAGRSLKEKATHYILEDYIHYLPSVAKKTGLEKEIALDAFTDAVMDMIEQVADGTFKRDSKLSSYFYKIFYFKCIDLSRKNTTKVMNQQEDSSLMADSQPSISEELETKEDINQLFKYLKQLGEPCQQILMDWGYWGYNMDEIAERAGLAGSVQAKDKKYRCLQRLRKIMGINSSNK